MKSNSISNKGILFRIVAFALQSTLWVVWPKGWGMGSDAGCWANSLVMAWYPPLPEGGKKWKRPKLGTEKSPIPCNWDHVSINDSASSSPPSLHPTPSIDTWTSGNPGFSCELSLSFFRGWSASNFFDIHTRSSVGADFNPRQRALRWGSTENIQKVGTDGKLPKRWMVIGGILHRQKYNFSPRKENKKGDLSFL